MKKVKAMSSWNKLVAILQKEERIFRAEKAYREMCERIGEEVIANTVRRSYSDEAILEAVRAHLATAPPSPASWAETARFWAAVPKAWKRAA